MFLNAVYTFGIIARLELNRGESFRFNSSPLIVILKIYRLQVMFVNTIKKVIETIL